MKRAISIAAAIAMVLASARPAAAQTSQTPVIPRSAAAESTLDARTRELAAQLRCPVCQGLSIQDSPSELSQEMRGVVKQQLAEGKSPDEIKRYFVARYGEWILMAPEAHGFNWIVYVLPFAVLGVGAWVLARALKRWRGTPDLSPVGAPPSGGAGTAM
jgi:cytochrome c-type biogenesis protein CcmH